MDFFPFFLPLFMFFECKSVFSKIQNEGEWQEKFSGLHFTVFEYFVASVFYFKTEVYIYLQVS